MFEQLLDGDLFNSERVEGTWKFVGKNKLKADSPKPSGTPRVKETIENRNGFLVICC